MNGTDRIRFVRLVDRFSQEETEARRQAEATWPRTPTDAEAATWRTVAGVWAAAAALLRDELGPERQCAYPGDQEHDHEMCVDATSEPLTTGPRAPTTCDFILVVKNAAGERHSQECGELIRWSQVNGWYHVMDARLGDVGHAATPPVGYGR